MITDPATHAIAHPAMDAAAAPSTAAAAATPPDLATTPTTMRAIAVRPGVPGSIHARSVPTPSIDSIEGDRGVLVRVLRVGLDGTDKEISQALYGIAPDGDDYLVIGHENRGRVVAAGSAAPPELRPGKLVVSTVRRPGHSVYDRLGMQDFTTDTVYYERGINLRHGYLAEYYVEDASYVVPLPPTLERVGVLLEPLTVAEKGINQASEIQRRLRVWRPARALVIGAGTIGLLASLVLRLEGIDVTVVSRRRAPYRNSDLLATIGAGYLSTADTDLAAAAAARGPFDLVFEASGFSPLAFEAMAALGANGVLVLSGVTGGQRVIEVDANRINQGFVLGNKVMVGTVSASRDDFVRGVDHLLAAEATYPGWLERLLTTPVRGLNDPAAVLAALEERDTIKAYVEIGPDTMEPAR
jgi:threonine dehydrogenase-like Zn-dependent dehydrogenase